MPNCIGFLLGTAQLIIYIVYKSKSRRKAKSDEETEGGSKPMVDLEMQPEGEKDEHLQEDDRKTASLLREKSSAKPSIHGKIAKSVSMSVYELRSDWFLKTNFTEAD